MASNLVGPMWEKIPVVNGVIILPADTTAKKNIATGGADGTRIDQISISSNDTAAVNLAFYIADGGTDYYIGNVPVAISAGYLAVDRVEGIAKLSRLGYLFLESGQILKVNAVVTITAAKQVDIVTTGGDF